MNYGSYTETVLLGGYTHDQLSKAFDKVANPSHWKGAIDVTLPLTPAELVMTTYAIHFFTATHGTFTTVSPGVYHVTAPGYWAGPAN